MSIEENKAIARRWMEEVWSKGNLAAIDELLAADFVFNYAPPGVAPDREGYKRTVTILCAPLPGPYTIEDMVAEGDKVVIRWAGRLTHKGEFMGIAPTGKEVTITGISIIRIVGGKIVEEWGEMDNLGVMQQLGVFPPLG
jgi:predicted ester cyclase